MYGNSIGTLRLKSKNMATNKIRSLWFKKGNQGNSWAIGSVTVSSQSAFQLQFEATRGSSFTGDIAIDDLRFYDGPCNPTATCDFEKETCTWKNDVTEDSFDWIMGQGSTPSRYTGPAADHTTQSGKGHYMFMEASLPQKQGDKARLVSEQIGRHYMSFIPYCVRFWVHMRGPSIGTLNLYIKTGPGSTNEKVIWTMSGNQGGSWFQGKAPVYSSSGYKLVFEAVHGGGYKGDIALDDIVYYLGRCPVTPQKANPALVTTVGPTIPPTTPVPTVYACNFEKKNLCLWTQDLTDNFNWTLNSGSTQTGGSGPSGDHTFNNRTGNYIYIEASYPQQPGYKARILSPYMESDAKHGHPHCVTFWYHMYGPHIDTLNVYKKSGGSMMKLWSRKGDNGDQWKYAQIDVSSTIKYQIAIEGVRGTNYKGDISIDDIDFVDGKCPPIISCDFEHGFCDAKPDPKMEFTWTRNKGATASKSTGPSFDHTLQTDQGYYIYTEMSGRRRYGDRARIVSPVIPGNQPACLSFWFHMRGFHIGKLNIYIKTSNGGMSLIWRRSGNHGDSWKFSRVNIRPRPGRQFIFEGVRGIGFSGDIALDDLIYADGYCPPPGDCSFENGYCSWSNSKNKMDDFDWIIGSGGTPSSFTGPNTDHTTGSKFGRYMYIEASIQRNGDKAWLVSEDFYPTMGRCLEFWTHMQGGGIGELNVYIRGQNGTMRRIWTLSGNQGDRWINAQAPVVSREDYQVVFEAVRGGGVIGDIAIDDILFTNFHCNNIPSNSVPPDPTTQPPPTVITTVMPTPIPNYYTCNFTKDKCSWHDDTTAHFNWTRNQGTTGSSNTGPTQDHTTGSNGWYVFIETSYPRKPNDTARLISDIVPATSQICLQFWYHMYGDHISNLTVYTKVGSKTSSIWQKRGTQGTRWKHAALDISSSSKFQVVFEGVKGSGYRGDIALDDLSLTDGLCPPQAECSFEDPKLCGWTNMVGDNFDWTRDNAGTSSTGTGPSTDHTVGTAKGYYMYIEASGSKRSKGHKAWLKSGTYKASLGRCLSFWYHMYGTHVGTLNVLINTNQSRSAPVWSLSGNQGNEWRPTRVTIKSSVEHSIIFEGRTGDSYKGDIAIDDVLVEDGPCADPGSCSFEKGTCGYTNLQRRDIFDWQVGSGTTSSATTGPTTDHSTGSKLGRYMFIESSYPRLPGEYAVLRSETIPTGIPGKCLQFWYHMNGADIGSLEVDMRVGNGLSETIVWELKGDQGNRWRQAQAPLLSYGQNIEVRFEAIRGNGYKGDIAIDDITVEKYDGNCPVQPTQAQPWGTNFETGFGRWTQSRRDKFDWKLNKGHTGSSGTGPARDHTTNTTYSYYAYIEASGRRENDTADLVSPSIQGNGTKKTYCLWFAYHMYGPHVGALKVYTKSQGQNRPAIWQRTGSAGPRWRHAQVSVNVLYNTQVVFEGTRGLSYKGDIAIDDLDIWHGDCFNSGVCTFEGADICGWAISTKGGQFKWQRASGKTGSSMTGPTNDHTYGTPAGHYMFIETSVGSPGAQAYMYSPWYYNKAQMCVQFFYHMYGAQIGTLDVFIRPYRSRYMYRMFSLSGNQNNTWHLGSASVTRKGYFQVVVRGIKGQGYRGDIAVDDFRVRTGACPAQGDCDFEHLDFCSWSQDTKDNFDWIIGSGRTSSVFTGPKLDHTTQSAGGYYAFIETSAPRNKGDRAVLKSMEFDPTASNGKCFSFWYHMFGSSIGTLKIFHRILLQGLPKGDTLMWTLSGNQANEWRQGRFSVKSKQQYQILFEAVRGTSYMGDIGIDDIEVTSGACSFLPAGAWPQGRTTPAPTPASTTYGPTASNQGYDCNFDVNVCTPYSRNSSSKHFQWLRHTGATTSRQTGPNNDHTTDSDKGSYMYVDASYPAKTNDVAWLIQKNIKNTNGFCMSFWYHMYGPHVGQLNIWLQTPSKKVLKWKRSGSQGDEWKHGQISISRSEGTPLTVIMEAIRGKGYAGDIGIDDVSYKATDQGCPAERECTFESSSWSSTSPGLLCGWQQEKSKDDFDWSISTGGTASTKTGPKFDHTLQTKFGHYVYIESSYPRKKGDQAMMISQPHTATPGQCFTFFYHKYGLTVSNLTLLMRIDNVDSPVWSRGEYNEGPFWHPALVTLKSPKKQFQLIFQAFVGSSYTGDIALDDLLLKDGECPAPGNCDFEGFGQCSYVQDASEDDFDWIRGHGGTNSWRTGPKVDHTKNSKTGHYYYIEASSPRKQGDKARMISEIFEPTSRTTGRCLQFYRHMYGASTGTFNVYVKWERGNSSDAEQLIWTDSGNQGDSWIQSQAPVFSDKRFRLVFEAVRGSSYTGDIALDDINFNNNFAPCTYIPPNSQPPTVAPTTITPQDSNCTFDTPCRWKQVTSDDFDWTIKSGKTGSGGTGPLGDHTTGNGKYAFIEASSPRKPNDTAVLRSPPIRPKLGAVCMQFYYHMHGSHINRMNIYKVVNGRRIRVWTRYGTQGNQWRLGQANIRGVNSIFNIEIEGVRGVSYEGDISIDDIVLTDGKCKPPPYCDFENGQCGWRNMRYGDKFNWRRSNGGTPSYGTGPKTDHTTGTKLGSYIYLETSRRQKGMSAIVRSRYYPANPKGSCLNFWYHMNGRHIGALNIYVDSPKSPAVWNRTSSQGNQWRHGRVTINRLKRFRVYIEGIVGNGYMGDIALDDIWFDDSPCPATGSCDFESQSFCTWSQIPNRANRTGYDDFDWILNSGRTPSWNTGPTVDHTLGTALGTYAFIEATGLKPGSKAQLKSEVLPSTDGRCLSFFYHMKGSGIGKLNFYVQPSGGVMKLSKTIDGSQENSWVQGEVNLASRTAFNVIIEAVHGTNFRGDISLDDINILEGNCVGTCSSVKLTARVACGPNIIDESTCRLNYGCCYDDTYPNMPKCFQHPATCEAVPLELRRKCGYSGISKYSCTKRGCCYDDTSSSNGVNCYYSFKEPTPFPPTLPPPTLPPPSKYDCGFESGMCGFTNEKGKDHFDWTRHKGSTASWGTGPTVDHTRGNSYGYYVYIETSKGKAGDTAVLMSPLIDFKNKSSPTVCVRFWYHMYGQHVGSLNLYYMSSNKLPKNPLWTRKGAIVNDWMYGQLVVPNSQFRVAFQGGRGNGYQGDISIDDVSFINGDCPARTFCDFENNHLCGWSQDTSDDFDWSFGYGNTTSWKTGPKWDHTYKTSFGNYLYIEGSGRSPGDRARIESFPQNPTQGSCLEFYYNMKGSGIGTLSVYVKRGNRVDAYPAWTLRGEQGERWFRGFLTVKEPLMTWRIIMEAVRGVDYNSDIAIDDVHFHQGECTPKGDCDFENGESCGYENDPNNKVDWLIYSGPTPSHNTGPSVDHTTGLATGYYLYMEASFPARKGDKALFLSEKFTVNPTFQWCMEFWYHMFGTGAGALRVKSKYTYPRNKRVTYSRPLFEMEGNFDDKWFFGQANISSRYDFQVTTCTRNDLTPVKWAIALEWLLVH